MKNIFLCFICLMFVSIPEIRAERMTAKASRYSISQGERVEIFFSFDGNRPDQIRDFRGPGLQNGKILSGPNQQLSVSMVNGGLSSSAVFSYIVESVSSADIRVGSAHLTYRGRGFNTAPFTIKVRAGAARQNTGGGSIAGKIFILATSDKKSAYKGEQVNLTYRLYTRLDLKSLQISKMPSYSGFWAEETYSPTSNINFTQEKYQGKIYNVATLKKVALFPTQTGSLTVTPFELNLPVVVRKHSPLDDLFGDDSFSSEETVNYSAKSNSLKINVIPFNGSKVPANFSGAVGQFKISLQKPSYAAKTNEPYNLRLVVSGRGNIKLLDMPELKLPSGVEKYDPTFTDNIQKEGQISGSKAADYVLIPHQTGQMTIDPIEFTYFDPDRKQFFTVRTGKIVIPVGKGKSETGDQDLEDMSRHDIFAPKFDDTDLDDIGSLIVPGLWFYLGLIISSSLFVFKVRQRLRRRKLENDPESFKRGRALSDAEEELRLASEALKTQDGEEFFNRIQASLSGYFCGKLGIGPSEYGKDLILRRLREIGAGESIVKTASGIFEISDMARFAPGGVPDGEREKLLENATELIKSLEEMKF